eukprot:221905-Amphidinium_carterae.1
MQKQLRLQMFVARSVARQEVPNHRSGPQRVEDQPKRVDSGEVAPEPLAEEEEEEETEVGVRMGLTLPICRAPPMPTLEPMKMEEKLKLVLDHEPEKNRQPKDIQGRVGS